MFVVLDVMNVSMAANDMLIFVLKKLQMVVKLVVYRTLTYVLS